MSIKNIWYKVKQIPLIGIPYEKYIGSRRLKKLYEKKSKIVQQFGIDNIKIIEEILEQVAPIHFVDFGTLLGTIRDHKFIAWDPDIDYGIVVDYSFNWDKLQRLMEQFGYSKLRQWEIDNYITEQTYLKGDLTIDIFAHYREKTNILGHAYIRFPGKKYKDGWFDSYEIVTPMIHSVRKEFLGEIQVSVPQNSEEYLSYIYNDDWMIPNPNWIPCSGKGAKLISDKQGRLIEY